MKYRNKVTGEIVEAYHNVVYDTYSYDMKVARSVIRDRELFLSEFTEVPEAKPEGHWLGIVANRPWSCRHTVAGRLASGGPHRLCYCTDGKHEVEKPVENPFTVFRNELLSHNLACDTTIANQRTELARLNNMHRRNSAEIVSLKGQVDKFMDLLYEII
jgi:hypothetical protein